MVPQEKIDDLIRRIVDAVHPDKIILFGSTARGTAGPYSDLDVLVIMPDGTHQRIATSVVYRSLAGFGLPDVDVVVATHTDIEKYGKSPARVFRGALQDGVELYAA